MSTIDDLQRLHEAATRGPWLEGPVFWLLRYASKHDIDIYQHRDGTPLTDEETSMTPRKEDAPAIVALHNAWPAIHRVLVAARALMQCPKCIGPCDDPTVHAEIEEALRALDDKEQRT